VEASGTDRDPSLAWVWQFNEDGDPDEIRDVLSQNRVGIILKTHEGTDWMARWDESPQAIASANHVRNLATFFELKNVPFHAWCVVEGHDPLAEARMCAEVLDNGARSLFLDLEPKEGANYWQAGAEEASAFGAELRRLQPRAKVTVAPDPRPWQLQKVPMAEFAAFSNEIAPQLYWRLFDSPTNHKFLAQAGFEVGPEGLTPETGLAMCRHALGAFGKPIKPIGEGAAGLGDWDRFVRRAAELKMDGLSVWRFGTSQPELWPLLAGPPEAAAPPAQRDAETAAELRRPIRAWRWPFVFAK
jgi:hypothetical protein